MTVAITAVRTCLSASESGTSTICLVGSLIITRIIDCAFTRTAWSSRTRRILAPSSVTERTAKVKVKWGSAGRDHERVERAAQVVAELADEGVQADIGRDEPGADPVAVDWIELACVHER